MELLKFSFLLFLSLSWIENINCARNSVAPKSTKAALVIVDVQNDFCEGGSLAVPDANKVIPIINDLRSQMTFAKVIFTMDWHPIGHISFYERFSDKVKYPQAKLFEDFTFDLGDGKGQRTQRLWPVHCLQNSSGAALHAGLTVLPTDIMVLKGTDIDVESYSGFGNEAEGYQTKLDQVLKDSDIMEIVVVGLAWEFCVGNTALDGIKKGYKVVVLEDATGSLNNDLKDAMVHKLLIAGVEVMTPQTFLNHGFMPRPKPMLFVVAVFAFVKN